MSWGRPPSRSRRLGVLAAVIAAHAVPLWLGSAPTPSREPPDTRHLDLIARRLPASPSPFRRSTTALSAIAAPPSLEPMPPRTAITLPAIAFSASGDPSGPVATCEKSDDPTRLPRSCGAIILPTLRQLFETEKSAPQGSIADTTLKQLAARFGTPEGRPEPGFQRDRVPLVGGASWQKFERWKEEFQGER